MAFAELKQRHSVVWGNGPYERITNTIRDIHALVVERTDPKPGERVLDAATGTGAVAILAAKRGADVVGEDLAPVLIETARQRAAEEGVEVDFQVGDAEDMPYDDASFDVVLSTCGVMFAPDHEAIARELSRVTKPGGRLGLACWKPETGMHDVFKMMAPFMPPPAPGAGSPFGWGDEQHVRELLGDAFELEFEEHDSPLTLASGEEYWELFSTSYGPTKTVVEALDPERREEFHRAWVAFGEARREGDAMVHHREYLLTLGTRR
ncbi:MAG TPA: class I SAM-dependent methyltransferase [Gaiellaceae bacterium]|jgi:SAM-dependent methyltransferase|nr:class I SAM-dependent methyltransferase [Gaiellaceae bacterium]